MTDPISNERLLPCPFCGGTPGRTGSTITCTNKNCWGPSIWHFANAKDAIAAWNRRPFQRGPQWSGGGMMASLLCSIFGHIRRKGWWGDGLYGKVTITGRDGIGRTHAHISLECDRCGKIYVAARFHPSTYFSQEPHNG